MQGSTVGPPSKKSKAEQTPKKSTKNGGLVVLDGMDTMNDETEQKEEVVNTNTKRRRGQK